MQRVRARQMGGEREREREGRHETFEKARGQGSAGRAKLSQRSDWGGARQERRTATRLRLGGCASAVRQQEREGERKREKRGKDRNDEERKPDEVRRFFCPIVFSRGAYADHINITRVVRLRSTLSADAAGTQQRLQQKTMKICHFPLSLFLPFSSFPHKSEAAEFFHSLSLSLSLSLSFTPPAPSALLGDGAQGRSPPGGCAAVRSGGPRVLRAGRRAPGLSRRRPRGHQGVRWQPREGEEGQGRNAREGERKSE